MKKFFILLFFILIGFDILAQIEVVVKAEKEFYDIVYLEKNISIENYKTISEAIFFTSGLNVIHKGFPLTQAHLFINGGSFEQVGIFVEDVKINDPQTGHYNFDFPWTLLDIEKIEIIKRGSTIFGSGSLNGLINLDIKEIKKDVFVFITQYGTYNTFYSVLRAEKKFANGGISLSAEKSFSDGYHEDTDFLKETIFLTGEYLQNKIYIGYDEKEYGAYDYYTPGKNMPSYEYVITRFGHMILNPFEHIKISLYIRTHSDVFTLNRNNPSYYQNNHLNILYGGLVKYNFYLEPAKSVLFQYNWQREEINSNILGYHHRIKNSGFVNSNLTFFDNIKVNINLSLENYDVYKSFDLLPSVNLNYELNNLESILYYSYSARYPNWTELYYQDPFNKGDSSLKPERSHEIGLSLNYKYNFIKLSGGTFYRYGFDLIDWKKNLPSDTIWQIKNIGQIITKGFNIGLEVKMFDFLSIKADYSYLDSYISKPYISKYGLAYLRSKISLISDLNLFDTSFVIQYNHKAFTDRDDTANNVNLIISKKLNTWLELSLKIENLLNIYFEEIKGIPAPYRIISGKMKVIF